MSKKQTRINTKENNFFGQRHREKTNMQKIYKFVKITKRKKIFETCRSFRKSFEMKEKKKHDSLKIKKHKIGGRSFQEENYIFLGHKGSRENIFKREQ